MVCNAWCAVIHSMRRSDSRKASRTDCALESTTTELQRRLAALRLDPQFVQRAVRLLRLSDQIKFARRPAESSEAAARIAETREIAAALETHLAPRDEAAASAPASSRGGAA